MCGIDSKKSDNGFTLIELIIVVAIIAVLVAIAIPLFRGQLENARKATCQANCRSLYELVQASHLTDNTSYADTFSKEYGTGNYSCPDGGAITCDPDTGIVSCSIHGSPTPHDSATPFSKDDVASLAGDFTSVMNKLLSDSTSTNNIYTASYAGKSYPYMSMYYSQYSKIDGKTVKSLLQSAGLSDAQYATLNSSNCIVAISADKKSALGAAYQDPNNSSKEIILYADGTSVSVDKGSTGLYTYYLADKSHLP